MAALNKVHLAALPNTAIVEMTLWQDMHRDTEQAKAAIPQKTPLTFVDLTAKALLPIYTSPDAVGGRRELDADNAHLDGQMDTSSLSKLTAALRSATATPRFIRNATLWMMVILRFAVVAVATQQWTWVAVINHMSMVGQIMEIHRVEMGGKAQYLGILYDELARIFWSERAERRDPEMLLEKVTAEPDKNILEAAKSRLAGVLEAAGLHNVARKAPGLSADASTSAPASGQAAE